MQFEIKFESKVNPTIYREFSEFIFLHMKKAVSCQVRKNYKKYKLRENLILSSSLIKWKRGVAPSSIDLPYYVENCLELVNIKGVYVIRLNEFWLVRGSLTRVKTLIRILEFGTLKIPPLPVVSRIFRFYSKNYKNLFTEFVKERVL